MKKSLIASVIADMDEDEEGWVAGGAIGSRLRNAYPDFDTRTYGRAKLSDLIRATSTFDTLENITGVSTRQGVELAASVPVGAASTLGLSFTYTDAMRPGSTPGSAARRLTQVPRQDIALTLDSDLSDAPGAVSAQGVSAEQLAQLRKGALEKFALIEQQFDLIAAMGVKCERAWFFAGDREIGTSLANLRAEHARVEQLQLPPFDVVVSRAFASLPEDQADRAESRAADLVAQALGQLVGLVRGAARARHEGGRFGQREGVGAGRGSRGGRRMQGQDGAHGSAILPGPRALTFEQVAR
mgnify:CR=1 FL=1